MQQQPHNNHRPTFQPTPMIGFKIKKDRAGLELEPRPLSSFGRALQDKKSKLMKKTNEIRRSVEANKSLIENVKLKRK